MPNSMFLHHHKGCCCTLFVHSVSLTYVLASVNRTAFFQCIAHNASLQRQHNRLQTTKTRIVLDTLFTTMAPSQEVAAGYVAVHSTFQVFAVLATAMTLVFYILQIRAGKRGGWEPVYVSSIEFFVYLASFHKNSTLQATTKSPHPKLPQKVHTPSHHE